VVSINPTTNSFNPWQYLKQYFKKLLPLSQRVKTPTLLQMEAVECGAAALGIIMYYFGLVLPLPELRRECGVSRDGSKASNMLKAARRYQLEAKGFKKELKQLRELPLPYIVFWNFNHFLVVEGWSKDKVYLNDPATGPCTVSLQEFDEAYTGVVLLIRPSAEFQKGGRQQSIFPALWSRLVGTTGALSYCLLSGLFLTLVGLVIPIFTQIFVDEILIQGRQLWLRPLLLSMAIAVMLQGGLTLLQLRYLRRLKIKLAVGMSSRFLWHILKLPIGFYAQRFAGEISSRTRLNDRVADILSGKLATTAIDFVMLGFYIIVMSQYDWLLTAIIVGFAFTNVLTLQWISRQRKDANQRLIQDYGKTAGVSIAALQSIETLKASGLESDFFARWSGYYTKAINSQQELGVANQAISVLPVLLSALSSTFFLIIGGLRVMDGYLSIGMLIAFQGMMQNFQQPVNNLVDFGSTLQELEGNLIRLDDVLSNPTDLQLEVKESREVPENPLFQKPKLEGYLELRNLTFGYSPLETPLIENFSLKVKPGQRIALVGGSGSGKSTIALLVSGIYQPRSGEILFDGKLRSQISTQLLTNSVAVVEQDILLFAGTIRDNLTLWDTTIPDLYIQQACRDSAIDDVIQSLPGSYNARLAEGGANLSGGQRQRLEIARALVNNPSILIMDEATSALDGETEKIIDRNLRRRGCTCLIIAHRLSTIRDCDEIIVLERGKIVQRGTHEELWQEEGVYRQMIKSSG
jgi:ATP-binding cassette, subfamily C, bacterial